MAHLSREEAAGLLERFHRHLRDHRLPVTPQRRCQGSKTATGGECVLALVLDGEHDVIR